jgi:4'-phosphopantetheinyl transferase
MMVLKELLSATNSLSVLLKRNNVILQAQLCVSKVSYNNLYAARTDYLHSKELYFFENLQHPLRQKTYLLGRYSAKQAIADYVGIYDKASMYIENGVFEQPVLHLPLQKSIQVSISHTNTWGGAIVFPEVHPMAIDLETICISKIDIIHTQLTETEKKLVTLSFEKEEYFLMLLWTAKEALSKVLKCGFMIAMELLEIESITQQEHFYSIFFKNFHQYRVIAFTLDQTICSIVLPKNTELQLDILALQKKMDLC